MPGSLVDAESPSLTTHPINDQDLMHSGPLSRSTPRPTDPPKAPAQAKHRGCPPALLFPQHDRRIDAGCAAGRQVGGGQRDGDEKHREAGVGNRLYRIDLEQNAGQ